MRCSQQHWKGIYASQCAVLHWGCSSNCFKNTRFLSPSRSMDNVMMSWNKRHPLLMKCFKSFLRCIRPMGGASGDIYKEFMGITVSFPTAIIRKDIAHKMLPDLCTLPVQQIGWSAVMRDIHCLYEVIEHLHLMYKVDGKCSDSTYYALMSLNVLFLTMVILKLHTKCQIVVGGTLSVWQIGCCTAMIHTHCLWSVSNPSLDA